MPALKTSEATYFANRQRPQRAHSRLPRLRRWSLPPGRQRSWLRPISSRGRGAPAPVARGRLPTGDRGRGRGAAAPVPRGRLRAGDRGRSSQLTYCPRSIASSSFSNIRGRCLATELEINGRLGHVVHQELATVVFAEGTDTRGSVINGRLGS